MENLTGIISEMILFFKSFTNSVSFSILKFFFGIYTVVILADIVLLLIQRGLGGDLRETLYGMNIPPELVNRKGKLRKKWDKVKEKIQSENESKWKVAIIEADNIIDDLIKRMGYSGENMSERLAGINPGQIENISELILAHEIRNRIIHEDNFKLSREKATELIGYYENFLKYFEVLK